MRLRTCAVLPKHVRYTSADATSVFYFTTPARLQPYCGTSDSDTDHSDGSPGGFDSTPNRFTDYRGGSHFNRGNIT